MEQPFPNELQVDLIDFRMRYDKTNGPSLLNMSKNHYHKSYEIYYLISGESYYFIKDTTFHIKAGDIVLVNSNDLHRTSLVNNDIRERILVCLNENFINSITSSYSDVDLFSCFKNGIPVLRLNAINSKAVQAHLYKMFNFYTNIINKVRKLDELYLKVMSVELLIMLNKLCDSAQPKFFEHSSILPQKISDVVIFVNNNYMNEITLDSISSHFNINKYYFVKLFKETIGLTFIDYLNIIRLKESQRILLKTNFTVSRISAEVGYSDSSYFCRVFKKYCKCSPTEYKKQRLAQLRQQSS